MDLLRADPSLAAMIPAGPPPAGVEVNFMHAEERGAHDTVVAVEISCMLISTLILGLRLYVRGFMMKSFQWLDFFAILGWGFALGFMGGVLATDDIRRGRHTWEMSMEEYFKSAPFQNLSAIFYCPAITFLKVSILLLFLYVFMPARCGLVYWTNIVLIGTNCLFYLSIMITMIFECVPRAKISAPYLDGRCVDVYALYLVTAIFNVVSDFFILIYPIWAIWRLKMSYARKWTSSLAFVAGTFALAASIVRLWQTTRVPHSQDIIWIIMHLAMWTSGELTAVVLCSNFPFFLKYTSFVKPRESPKSLSSSDPERPIARLPNREKEALDSVAELERHGAGDLGDLRRHQDEEDYSPV